MTRNIAASRKLFTSSETKVASTVLEFTLLIFKRVILVCKVTRKNFILKKKKIKWNFQTGQYDPSLITMPMRKKLIMIKIKIMIIKITNILKMNTVNKKHFQTDAFDTQQLIVELFFKIH